MSNETQYDQEALGTFDTIVSRINLSFMGFGILGNLACISVLFQATMLRKKFHLYLLALAFGDILYCIIVFCNYMIYIGDPPNLLFDFSEITCYLTDYIVGSIDAFCVFITLVVSVDRLYAITRPIKIRDFATYRYPRLIVLFNIGAILAFKSPEVFLSQREYELTEPNATEYICTSKSLKESTFRDVKFDKELRYYIYICNVILPIMLHIIPTVAIVLLNMVLWFYIRNYTKTSKNLTQGEVKRREISSAQKSHYFTIIILGLWLLVTIIPYFMFNTIYWYMILRQMNVERSWQFLMLQGVSSVFFNLNHCVNILIYLIFHKDFKIEFLAILVRLFNLNPVVKINRRFSANQPNHRYDKRPFKSQSKLASNNQMSSLVDSAMLGKNDAQNDKFFVTNHDFFLAKIFAKSKAKPRYEEDPCLS